MIHAALKDWRKHSGLAMHPVWQSAFHWLEACPTCPADGIYPLGQDGFFARVMSYALKARDAARYENHRHTIDIQYTIQGAEQIEMAPLDLLTSLGDYSSEKDAEHYKAPSAGHIVVANRQGWFTVIFPGEPHMPQLRAPGADCVQKVVIKIPEKLVS